MSYLRKYCKEKGITFEELARITGISEPQLYYMNRLPSLDPKVSTMVKLYNATGLTPADYSTNKLINKSKLWDCKNMTQKSTPTS